MPTYTNPRVRDAVRTFDKHVLNPAMLLLAGRRHRYVAALRHIGRTSGNQHTSPEDAYHRFGVDQYVKFARAE